MKRALYILLLIGIVMSSCQDTKVTTDPTAKLTFSKDTILFDTVFTSIGSSTYRLMVYNHNQNALRIDRAWLQNGQYFRVNLDGENSMDKMRDIEVYGGDSLFVFLRVYIDPQASNSPVFVEDTLHFSLNGNIQDVLLQAYGKNVTIIRSQGKRTDLSSYTFTKEKPYLIYDSVVISGKTTIQPGATLYMHKGASLWLCGSVSASGTLEEPITVLGDRLDHLFDSVPYAYAAGMWDGIYLLPDPKAVLLKYTFNYVDIRSGNIGLYCLNSNTKSLPTLTMTNSRIHNHSVYGMVLQNVNAKVVNTEISNCASYCVYLSGGTHQFIHSTIASYFNSTSVRIQSTTREDVAAVYINNLSKTNPETNASFLNSIITGERRNQLVVATPLTSLYQGEFVGNYLKTDTLTIPGAKNNVYWTPTKDKYGYTIADTISVFRNTFYKYQEYKYYDFRLDSLSPARGIGDSLTAVEYPTDRYGISRLKRTDGTPTRPDAGCYQYAE